ncbi:MAG: ABC transporter ATP-binding protein, partial [Gammaproteobacteria bacterium]
RIGYLPEEKGLYKDMRVADVVAYFGELKGLSHREALARAKDRLRTAGLGDWISAKCNALSKGMSQKAQVIATLLHDPELVVLDEPFSGLDPVNSEMVLELIKRYKREGRTVIFSTHVVEHAEQICDSVVIIDRGRRKIAGPLAEVKAAAKRTVVLDYEGNPGDFTALPGVVTADDSGQHAELTLDADADSQALLATIAGRVTIRRFDTREASLKQIFLNVVEEDAREAA